MENARGPLALLGIGAALAIGTVVGVVVGYFGKAFLSEPKTVVPPVEVIQDEISEEDLLALCSELTQDEKTKVIQAQERVKTLESQIADKEKALADYKAKEEKDESRRAAAAKKWKEMEEEIASLRIQLAEAVQERDELRVELNDTIQELRQTARDLDRQIEETKKQTARAEHYKSESTKNLWSAFMANAKVEVCDRGTRKRHEKCHDAVEEAFTQQMRDKFTTCVDSYQAVPVLKQAEKKDFTLPQFAEWLPDDNKFTKKGWYVIFCDPTLPEATDIEGGGLPSEPGSAPVEPEIDLEPDEEDGAGQ